MKKFAKLFGIMGIFLAGTLLPVNTALAANGDVAINSDNFPNEAFREYVTAFDSNSDGILSLGERAKVSEMDIEDYRCTSLKGVEYFTELQTLEHSDGKLEGIDVSKNTKLKYLGLIRFDGTELDISHNTNLERLTLYCTEDTDFRKLDVSKNPKLYNLYVKTPSTTNGLEELVLKNNSNLRFMAIQSCNLKSVNLSQAANLYKLELTNCPNVPDLSKNGKLDTLECNNMHFTKLDVSKNLLLEALLMHECYELERLDVDNNTRLISLVLDSPKIKSLSLTKQPKLWNLECNQAKALETLDVSENAFLEKLVISQSQLKELKLNSDDLQKLIIDDNQGITSLDLSNCRKLRKLYNAGITATSENQSGETCYEYTKNMKLNSRTKVKNNVMIQVLASENSRGHVEGGGIFTTGEYVTLRAYEYSGKGYKFEGFKKVEPDELTDYKEGELLSTNSTYGFNATEDMIIVAVFKQSLPNEVKASSYSPYCGGTLSVTVEKLPGESTLGKMTYQWYRGDEAIKGASKATYVTTKDDIGYELSCLIQNTKGDSAKIFFEGVIDQSHNTKAPEGLETVATSRKGAEDGSILGTTTEMEYSNSADFKTAYICGKEKTGGLKAGTYYVRFRETKGRVAGDAVKLVVENGPAVLSGIVSITGTAEFGQTLYAEVLNTNSTEDFDLEYQWLRNGKEIKKSWAEGYTLVKEDIGQTISCKVTSKTLFGSITGYVPGKVVKRQHVSMPYDVEVVAPSREGLSDGKITNLTTEMEYATKSDFSDKKACTKKTINVKAGTYYVRYAETDTAMAGSIRILNVPEGPAATDVFKDVKKGEWYEAAVRYVYSKGIMNGVSGQSFQPGAVMTRAQFVTTLHNLAGKPTVTKQTGFKDVPKGSWFEPAVNWAYSVKITSGVSKTQFGSEQKITRQQAAVMLYQYAKIMKMKTDLNAKELEKYPDRKKVASWAEEAIAWAVHNGVISGKLQGKKTILAPDAEITRAECAQMIKNLMDKAK